MSSSMTVRKMGSHKHMADEKSVEPFIKQKQFPTQKLDVSIERIRKGSYILGNAFGVLQFTLLTKVKPRLVRRG